MQLSFLSSRLAVRIALISLLIGVAWTVVGTSTLLYFDYQKIKKDVIDKVVAVGTAQSQSISRSLWEYDKLMLQTQLDALLQLPAITYGALLETDGTLWQTGKTVVEDFQLLEFPLEHSTGSNSSALGILKIMVNFTPLHQDLKHRAIQTLISQGINTFAISFTIWIVFYFFAGRYLVAIASKTKKLQLTNLDDPIVLQRTRFDKNSGDELDTLANALNTMRTNLISALVEIRSSEERHRRLFETMSQGVVYQDLSGKVLSANSAALKAFGLDEKDAHMLSSFLNLGLVGDNGTPLTVEKHPFTLALQSSRAVMGKVVGTRIPGDNEQRWLRISAIPQFKDKRVEPYQINTIFEDITEQKKLEQQLIQAQKMDAIGHLAGGIAHDFNNMLGGIMGSAEMLSLKLSDEKKARKYLGMITDTSTRAAGLTRKLLTFSRSTPKASSSVDIHSVLTETITLLQTTIDRRIEVTAKLKAQNSMTVGDPAMLQNAFLNMGINSSHAIEGNGEIIYTTKNCTLDSVYCDSSQFELEPGEYVLIKVIDTGTGILKSDLQRIFEPFFTTKEKGKGTGMGLAAVYGTICQHGGEITVQSEQRAGTTFQILLPLTDNGIQKRSTKEIRRTGTENILVVDDEEYMRTTASAILSELGYSVEVAVNGQEAVEKYSQAQTDFDLVILDMIMPVMNGSDCFFSLQKIDPDVRIILSSGFTGEEDIFELRQAGLKGFIRKPYSMATLSEAVYEALQ